jgi:ubiquinone/menaquinone biosynthesis C-methylase UbiE
MCRALPLGGFVNTNRSCLVERNSFELYWSMRKATFDSVASFYPLLERVVFGSTLSRSRKFFARRVMEGNNILLIGEGNGQFLFEMLKQTPSASFTVVDSSARMLASAARRISAVDRCARIEWVHADILEWQSPAARYDRVVTHFFLDLFTPYRICRIVEKISHLATEQTLWINVDFTSENRRFRRKLLMWAQYRFFRIVAGIEAARLFDSIPYIREAGWELLEGRSLESGWISGHLMWKSVAQPCSPAMNGRGRFSYRLNASCGSPPVLSSSPLNNAMFASGAPWPARREGLARIQKCHVNRDTREVSPPRSPAKLLWCRGS